MRALLISKHATYKEHHDLQTMGVLDPEANSYELVKERHELRCFKVRTPNACIVITDTKGYDQDPYVLELSRAKDRFRNKYFYEKKEDGTYEQHKFMSRWLADKTARTVDRLTVDPTGGEKDAYNLWRAPLASTLDVVDDGMVAELVQPIIDHIQKVICNGDSDRATHVLEFLSNILKHPEQRSERGLYVYGETGAGASLIFKFFCSEVLGPYNSFQTYNQTVGLDASRNSTFHRSCVLVGGVRRTQKILNHLITKKTVCFRRKNSRSPVIVNNLVNLIVTSKRAPNKSNNNFDVFHCRPKLRVGKLEYFDMLLAHLRRPEVARAFYQFLT